MYFVIDKFEIKNLDFTIYVCDNIQIFNDNLNVTL